MILRVLLLLSLSAPVLALQNQLRDHPSPYLAMHGDDPVAWQDWGPEAVALAREQGKLLFVSSGYFSCHWCHVMQRESYRNTEIAELLNARFIPVKLDRELHGALDGHLIDFLEKTQGRAGWPLNVFLTPEGYPLIGATYLPAERFKALVGKFDFSRYATLCDVGGATAQLSCLVAAANPHLTCTSFDLPQVAPIAEKRIRAAGLGDRVSAVAGDFFADALPKADVITMGMILHDWNLEKKRHLIRAAYEALPEGGVFVVIENLIDDARRENLFGLLMSLNMLIEFGDAFDFTGADFREWCEEAGFKRFEVHPLGGPCSAAAAYK